MNAIPKEDRTSTDRFVRRQNIQHYVHLLEAVTDKAERNTLLKLLAEERKKQTDAHDPVGDRPG
jgi:hypothetical protein